MAGCFYRIPYHVVVCQMAVKCGGYKYVQSLPVWVGVACRSVGVRPPPHPLPTSTTRPTYALRFSLGTTWADPGGSPLFGPRCRLFNIGPKAGPLPGPPLFACRPEIDPPPPPHFQKSWIRPCTHRRLGL